MQQQQKKSRRTAAYSSVSLCRRALSHSSRCHLKDFNSILSAVFYKRRVRHQRPCVLANRCCPPPVCSPSSSNTLWEVISLPVLALPGQPSGAATSLCPSVPRLHGLPASSRERGGGERGGRAWGVSSESPQDTHDTHTQEGWGGCTKACALQYKQRFFFFAEAAASESQSATSPCTFW